jgi:hypothetical protein
MSEANRVFARMTTPGTRPAAEDTKLLHIAPRRQGAAAGQGRVVEVVRRRSSRVAPPVEPADPPARSVHAATWPEGFQACPAPIPPPADAPAKSPDPALPVGHVKPGWEPLLAPVEPAEPAAKPLAGPRRQPRATRALAKRCFADPFAAEDIGANCRRCGYLVEPEPERYGLMTCASCD